jgi:hypothetical protein
MMWLVLTLALFRTQLHLPPPQSIQTSPHNRPSKFLK